MIVDTEHAALPIAPYSKQSGTKSGRPTNPRTQTDEAIKAGAKSGGIFGISRCNRAVDGLCQSRGLWFHTGYINLTRGLVANGYSKEDIAHLAGAIYLSFWIE
ncbi:expressed unknown protein [Seminavis robusta]|uniref:Uncharacterized protein n=1 Tax=Seminavis robusta TaxID=568900 RepID=A0A9N8ENZ1_9STRA|nr:expressed unknown protein [Seminavis robusta]|eukprot:Sro1310_g261710.1 n/a (103) ;mRNA; r:29372-29751